MNILGILENIGFDWQMALANFVNFLIIFYLLKRFAFTPIKRVLQERARRVEQGLEDAKRAEAERIMAEEMYEKRLSEARSEANMIVAGARTREESIVAKAQEKAETEARRIKREAENSAAKERERMEREIHERVADLVVAGVEKLLRENISPEREERVIRRMMA
jgi:F-type H+-transporting ATPase subunit b